VVAFVGSKPFVLESPKAVPDRYSLVERS